MSPFLEMMIEATAPWALVSVTILAVMVSYERDRDARRRGR